MVIRVGVRVIRDTKLSLDAIDGITEHAALKVGYVSVKAIGSSDDAGYGGYDAVKTGGGVTTEFDVRVTGGKGVVHL